MTSPTQFEFPADRLPINLSMGLVSREGRPGGECRVNYCCDYDTNPHGRPRRNEAIYYRGIQSSKQARKPVIKHLRTPEWSVWGGISTHSAKRTNRRYCGKSGNGDGEL
jgi:hypothetical protein